MYWFIYCVWCVWDRADQRAGTVAPPKPHNLIHHRHERKESHNSTHSPRYQWLNVGFHYPSSRPELTGVKKMHPSSRSVNSARELGPWTRVVETDLKQWLTTVTILNVSLSRRHLLACQRFNLKTCTLSSMTQVIFREVDRAPQAACIGGRSGPLSHRGRLYPLPFHCQTIALRTWNEGVITITLLKM